MKIPGVIPITYRRKSSATEEHFLNLEYEKPIRDAVELVWKYHDHDGNGVLDQNEASEFIKETLKYISPSICGNYDQQKFAKAFIDRINYYQGGIGKVEMASFIRQLFSRENGK